MTTRAIMVVAIAISLAACEGKPLSTVKSNNPEFDISLLFEHDGCKVYRFSDDGRWRYWADCRGSISWSEQEGKVTRPVEVPTP